MTVSYIVSRDSASTDLREEDAAMAHVTIGTFDSQPAAQKALQDYMKGEVTWLTTGKYVSARSLRRAADLMDGVVEVATFSFETSAAGWQRRSAEAAGLTWSMTRIER